MILDPKTSQKIFALAKDQQDELEGSNGDDDDEDANNDTGIVRPRSFDNDDEEDFDSEMEGQDIDAEEEYAELVRNSILSLVVRAVMPYSRRKLMPGTWRPSISTCPPTPVKERRLQI